MITLETVTEVLFDARRSNSTELPLVKLVMTLFVQMPFTNQLFAASHAFPPLLPRHASWASEICASGGRYMSGPMLNPGCGG